MKRTRPAIGRRTKLTPRTQKRIVAALRVGNYTTVAAEYAGIGRATFYRWLKRGQESRRGLYRNFYEAVQRAHAEAEVMAVAVLRKHMETDWQAAVAWLERKFPERWRKDRPISRKDPADELAELLGCSRLELYDMAGL